jgi:hypothetical protein
VTGQLVPPACPNTLPRVVAGLLADAPRRRRYGTAAVQRARSHHSWSTVAQAVTEVYERVRQLAAPPARRTAAVAA